MEKMNAGNEKMGEMNKHLEVVIEYFFNTLSANQVSEILTKNLQNEYFEFLEKLKNKTADEIIWRTQEIYIKESIVCFCESYGHKLSKSQIIALLNCKNTLDEMYKYWLDDGINKLMGEIGTAIKQLADKRAKNAQIGGE